MPCKPVVARVLLKDGKQNVSEEHFFTMKLLVDNTKHKQEVVAGMDTSSKTFGGAAVAKGKVVYQ